MKKGFYTVGSLIILLICAFVFVMLPALTGRGQKQNELPAFGKYNGKEIRYEQNSDFANYVSQYGQYFQRLGYQIDNSTYYQIFNYAFNSTVSQMAYTDAVNKTGWKAPVSTVNRAMMPYFTDETGKYSSKVYKSASTAQIEQVRKEVEKQLTSSRYYNDVFGSETELVGTTALYGIKESNAELDFLSNLGADKRGFDMVVFDKASYPDSEKAAYLKDNTKKFVKYDMSVITVDAENTAKTVAKRLKNEEITFADAVSEYSTKNFSNTEGKLSSTFAYQIEKIIADEGDYATLTSLKTGETSDIIATSTGYSIFHIDSNSVTPDTNDEELLKNVNSYLSAYETSVIENYFIGKAKDFVADASINGFDAACTKQGVEKVTVEPFPLNYGNVSLADTLNTSTTGLSGAHVNENFLTTAFSLKLNEFSEPVVLGNNVVVLQYTQEVQGESDEASVLESLDGMNIESAQNTLLASPKLENHVTEVYFTNFLQ